MAPRIPTPPEIPVAPAPAEVPQVEEELPVVTAKGTRDITNRVPQPPREPDERVTMIAHDLKTPLAIIMLEAQLLADKLPPELYPAVRHSIDRITQNVAYIDRLIADLLDLASVEAGMLRQQLRVERVELALLLDETVERAVSSIDRQRVHVEVRQPAAIRGDRNRLERVLANFIGNALKYSASPVTVVLDRTGQRARVRVIDQGVGLTPEQARTVFDRYRRVANTRGGEGYGLGLYISRKIIDAHLGRIGVVSIVGQGSEFFFELDTID